MPEFWNVISAISAAVAALVVIVAAIYARGQVAEAKRSREVSLLLSIHERYHEERLLDFRVRMFSGAFDNVDALSDTDKALLGGNVDMLELLAIAVDRGLLDYATVLAAFHSSPPRVLEMARRYLDYANVQPNVMTAHLERLVARYAVLPPPLASPTEPPAVDRG